MSTDATPFPLNSAESTPIFQKDIKVLESQPGSALVALQDAQRLVDKLTIEERKAVLSPIHFLPHELLSLIFELCALDYWRSPLRIACVSRHLRNAILNTPQAWCTLLIEKSHGINQLYFERSGQCKLHIGRTAYISFPKEVAPRIKCMTTRSLESDDPSTIFSSLERLSGQGRGPPPKLSRITTISFPALRHLDLSNVTRYRATDPSSFPPLESLMLCVNDDWLSIILGCNTSLKSLSLFMATEVVVDIQVQIDLPVLHRLNLMHHDLDSFDLSWLSVNAPALQVYRDEDLTSSGRCRLTNGWQNITHLRVDSLPPSSELKSIRCFQLRSSFGEIDGFLQKLGSGEVILNHLKSLEFSKPWIYKDKWEYVTQILNDWESVHYPGLRPSLVDVPWAIGPPWDLVHPCDTGMPCNPDFFFR